MAISVDAPAKSAELATKLGVTFPLLADEKLVAGRAWGVEDAENGISWPSIFVVAADGRIAWRSLSQTYKVRAGVGEILQALDALPRK